MPANDWSAYLGDAALGGVPGTDFNFFDPMDMGFNPIDPFGFLGGLFGDDKPSWKPYTKNGQYYWADPRAYNPVPADTKIPGARVKPSEEYRDVAQQVRIMSDLLPYYSRAVAGQVIPQAQANFAATQAVSEPYTKLMADLYAKYGPQLNQIGSDIARQNALNQAGTDLAVLQGPGRDLISEAVETQKIADPEYYKTRELTSNRLGDLLSSINLGSGLSPTEQREIEQGLAREGTARGTYGSPSQSETVANAMRYGEAGRNRELQNQNSLSQAIAASTAFLPASRSGMDVFQVATGRPSTYNTGENKFTGLADTSNQWSSLGNMSSQLLGNANQQQMANAQIDANKKDWLDKFSQFTSAVGNLGSMAGGAMAMCWVAREVYGVDNPRWKEFRAWMLTKAPAWFRRMYLQKGAAFAEHIKDKPELKLEIRTWMDTQLGY